MSGLTGYLAQLFGGETAMLDRVSAMAAATADREPASCSHWADSEAGIAFGHLRWPTDERDWLAHGGWFDADLIKQHWGEYLRGARQPGSSALERADVPKLAGNAAQVKQAFERDEFDTRTPQSRQGHRFRLRLSRCGGRN